MKRIVLVVVIAVLISLVGIALTSTGASANGLTCSWSATAADDSMNNAANWTGCSGGVPGTGDSLTFPATSTEMNITHDIAGSPRFANLTFGGGYNISGNDLLLSGNMSFDGSDTLFQSNVDWSSTTADVTATIVSDDDLTVYFGTAVLSGGAHAITFAGNHLPNQVFDFENTASGTSDHIDVQDGAYVDFKADPNTYVATNGINLEEDSGMLCNSDSCFGDSSNIVNAQDGGTDLDTDSIAVPNDIDVTGVGWIESRSVNSSLTGDITFDQTTAATIDALAGKDLTITTDVALINSAQLEIYGEDETGTITMSGGFTGDGVVTVDHVKYIASGQSTFSGLLLAQTDGLIQMDAIDAFSPDAAYGVANEGAINVAVPGTITSPIYLSGVGNTNNIAGFEAAITDNALTGDVVFSGPISVVSNTLVDNKQAASGHDLIFSGVISGTGTFNTFTEDATLNNGAVVIAGTSPNTFNGSLMNQGGRLELAKSGAAPHNVTVKDGIVYVTNPSGNAINGFLNLDTGDAIIQSDLTLTGLAGTGIFGVAADTQVTLDISDMDTFNGILSDDSGIAGARSIIKTGSGEFISTSSFPTNFDLSFPITFKVAQGSASFTNPNPNELDVVVDGGTLKGTGQLGTITASSGDVSPGNSPGCLTSNGNVDLGSSSSFDVEIAGTTLCTEYDQLISQGTIDLGNAELGLTLLSGYSPSVGDTFTIIRGTSISGHFANLADGAEFVSGTTKYRVNYTATTVVLTVTQINIAPALPTTGIAIGASVMTALLLLATGFVLARRRRPLL